MAHRSPPATYEAIAFVIEKFQRPPTLTQLNEYLRELGYAGITEKRALDLGLVIVKWMSLYDRVRSIEIDLPGGGTTGTRGQGRPGGLYTRK